MRFTTGTEVYQELIEAYHQATKGASPGESTPPRQQSTATAGWNDVLNLSAPDDDNPDADNILRSLGKGLFLPASPSGALEKATLFARAVEHEPIRLRT